MEIKHFNIKHVMHPRKGLKAKFIRETGPVFVDVVYVLIATQGPKDLSGFLKHAVLRDGDILVAEYCNNFAGIYDTVGGDPNNISENGEMPF